MPGEQPAGSHRGAAVGTGAPLAEARVAVVAAHGRDQDAAYVGEHLVAALGLPGVAWLLPQADGGSWYPMRFTAPQAELEPWREASLDAYDRAIDTALAGGVPLGRIVVCGFSQGACLMAELLARRPRPFAAAGLLTGCLMGPPGDVTAVVARLDGLPVHASGARTDAWIAPEHVAATARALDAAGARVTHAPREDPEHRIAPADVAAMRALIEAVGR